MRAHALLPVLLLCAACPDPSETDDAIADADGDGFGVDVDCDDTDPDTFPGATETCDGVDRDCNGTIDDDYAADGTVFFIDADRDGFGTTTSSQSACERPDGFVENADDCDDSNKDINPNAQEVCNLIDDDCNSLVDDEAIDRQTYFVDSDGDGYGDPSLSRLDCEAPLGWVDNDADCDDTQETINPDTVWFIDDDADGYGTPDETTTGCRQPGGYAATDDDCDDTTDRRAPGNDEVCDRLDNDCDEIVDDGGSGCDDFLGTYTGAYAMQAQEKLGTSVINDMRCGGSFELVVDYTADPPAQGTVTCSHSRYPGFDSTQGGPISGEIHLDGSFTWTLEHKFNSYANRTYDADGSFDSGLSFSGTGTMRPNSMSAVAWQVSFEGSEPVE